MPRPREAELAALDEVYGVELEAVLAEHALRAEAGQVV